MSPETLEAIDWGIRLYSLVFMFHLGLFRGAIVAAGMKLSWWGEVQAVWRALIWPYGNIETLWWRYGPRKKDKFGDPWLTRRVQDPDAQTWNSFRHKRCPECGVQGKLLSGPHAGECVNILCDWCGARYNLARYRGHLIAIQQTAPGPRMVPDEERELFQWNY